MAYISLRREYTHGDGVRPPFLHHSRGPALKLWEGSVQSASIVQYCQTP